MDIVQLVKDILSKCHDNITSVNSAYNKIVYNIGNHTVVIITSNIDEVGFRLFVDCNQIDVNNINRVDKAVILDMIEHNCSDYMEKTINDVARFVDVKYNNSENIDE